MARIRTVLDNSTYRSTERIIGPFPLPKTTNYIGIGVDRTGWTDPSQELTVTVETAPTSTGPWSLWFSFTCDGRPVNHPLTGTPLPESYVIPGTYPADAQFVRARIRTNGVNIRQSLVLLEESA